MCLLRLQFIFSAASGFKPRPETLHNISLKTPRNVFPFQAKQKSTAPPPFWPAPAW